MALQGAKPKMSEWEHVATITRWAPASELLEPRNNNCRRRAVGRGRCKGSNLCHQRHAALTACVSRRDSDMLQNLGATHLADIVIAVRDCCYSSDYPVLHPRQHGATEQA